MFCYEIYPSRIIIIFESGFLKYGEKKDIDIIYTVITRFELIKLNFEIEKIDPYSFEVVSTVTEKIASMKEKNTKRLKQKNYEKYFFRSKFQVHNATYPNKRHFIIL